MLIAQQAREWARTGIARSVRESAGVSVVQMAEFLDVAKSSLLEWESRDHSRLPRVDAAARWGRVLRALMTPAYHGGPHKGQIPPVD